MPDLFPSAAATAYAQIAVERGVDRFPQGLTYALPEKLAGITPGERVIVPLGRGNTDTAGYVIEVTPADEFEGELDLEKIKPVLSRDQTGIRLPPRLMALARWISSYYCAPIGMTLATMLPAAVKRGVGSKTRMLIDLGDPPPVDEKLPPKQRQVLKVLSEMDTNDRPIEIRKLADAAEAKTTGPIKRLLERNLLEAISKTSIEALWQQRAVDPTRPDTLTDQQEAILTALTQSFDDGFSSHLLHGVTGSGKTEIYIRLVKEVIKRGKVAMILVPEIALTPQTGGRLIGRFPDHRVAVLHSGLTSAQRHQQWALAAAGKAPIVLGARSAVFAPIPDEMLGVIIVDEEHDGSYKQDQTPRYHGRDVAIRRAQLTGCPVLLGSATPSLESWRNATSRKTYRLHQLTRRAPGLRVPKVEIVDFLNDQRQRTDRRIHLLGPRLENAVRETLDCDGQVLLLLNRRGYANYIACPDQMCGWVMTCDHCDATMVCHKNPGRSDYVRCHHCLAEQRLAEQCPTCGRKVSVFGLGTQRVEEELKRKFGLIDGETMQRIDSDAMHRASDFHDALDRFASGQLKLLVGTQMIAKGLDFPNVKLVGVISGDTAINLPDFRASERTFQLVSQVAGRCGRSDFPGVAIVQTFQPDTPAIQLAAKHDYNTFARDELAHREQFGLPPAARMVRLVVRDEDHPTCIERTKTLQRQLKAVAEDSIRFRGPMPCPIARIADHHRWQITLLADTPAPLQRLLAEARGRAVIQPGANLIVDVDPISLL